MINLPSKIENNLELENNNKSEDTVNNINKEEILDKNLINQTNLLDETMDTKNNLSDKDLDINSIQENNKNFEVTNCLALTVKKDYNLTVVKNITLKALKTTWKVVASLFTLNFLKIFFLK